ncbi:hypothetical protein HDU87_001304 [Geranomyces variabilis]|uniref:Uncharacterized protein n=1 Tax=Geranomyces variabilis TaxID=109894 RepID=A0AAD5XSM8_9FUNG|nr:hypothetical protein HDU87_001304 [Geranomyces variabilis]
MSTSGKYLVIFKPDTPDHVLEKAAKDVEAKASFQAHEALDYIEADGEVSAYAKSKGIGK